MVIASNLSGMPRCESGQVNLSTVLGGKHVNKLLVLKPRDNLAEPRHHA